MLHSAEQLTDRLDGPAQLASELKNKHNRSYNLSYLSWVIRKAGTGEERSIVCRLLGHSAGLPLGSQQSLVDYLPKTCQVPEQWLPVHLVTRYAFAKEGTYCR